MMEKVGAQLKGNTIITTVIHKFDNVSKKGSIIDDENIFILIDECHRTQSGNFHNFMRDVLPNAIILGFTGTPLLNAKEKGMAPVPAICHAYIEWLYTQKGFRSKRFNSCWIGNLPELNVRRAPGQNPLSFSKICSYTVLFSCTFFCRRRGR